jgi:hypothetical protein
MKESRVACYETNLIHYVSPVNSVTVPLHISDLLVAHHQEVTMYICNKWYVLYVSVGCQLAWLERNQSNKTYDTYQLLHIVHCYPLMMGSEQVRNM